MIETQDNLTAQQVETIVDWHTENIGTDYEVNPDPSGEPGRYYVIFLDLTPAEHDKQEKYLDTQGIGEAE